LTTNELVFPFGANFGENRSRNATVRVPTDDTQIYWQTDANRLYNLSLAICYSYGTDNKTTKFY